MTTTTFEGYADRAAKSPKYWRVEGSLFEVGAIRQVGFFTWNSQSFSERWARRFGMALVGLTRPLAYAANRTFATRLLHVLLRGVSHDRLDLLGEEYFQYVLKPQLRREAVDGLLAAVRDGDEIVLVSQLLEHVIRPLAQHLGVTSFISNRLEFREGYSTGRLLPPVVRPRGPLAWIAGSVNGHLDTPILLKQLGWMNHTENLKSARAFAVRKSHPGVRAVACFNGAPRVRSLPVRETLAGKHILLVGVTGFIGKVWLVDLLEHVSEIGKITLLIRRNRTSSAQRRFQKIIEESPAFDSLQARYDRQLGPLLKQKVDVVEGDVSLPGLGLDARTQERLQGSLDLIVNSAGLTDFNPDLREAVASNIDAIIHLVKFLRGCSHAGLMHLSTCYVVGMRDGRVSEELHENYTPALDTRFETRREIDSLREMVARIEARAESPELTRALQRQALGRSGDPGKVPRGELEGVVKRNRARWARNRLVRVGMRRARYLGWPNT